MLDKVRPMTTAKSSSAQACKRESLPWKGGYMTNSADSETQKRKVDMSCHESRERGVA